MSPEEVKETAEKLRNDLVKLAHESIGYSNYQRIMASYQRIMNDTVVCIRELAEALTVKKD